MFILTISYEPETDMVRIDGPLGNPILCYGMLARANDLVRDYIDKMQRENSLEIASLGNSKELKKRRRLN